MPKRAEMRTPADVEASRNLTRKRLAPEFVIGIRSKRTSLVTSVLVKVNRSTGHLASAAGKVSWSDALLWILILDRHDGFGTQELRFGQILQMRIRWSMAIRHFDVVPTFERAEQYEQVGGGITLALPSATDPIERGPIYKLCCFPR